MGRHCATLRGPWYHAMIYQLAIADIDGTPGEPLLGVYHDADVAAREAVVLSQSTDRLVFVMGDEEPYAVTRPRAPWRAQA